MRKNNIEYKCQSEGNGTAFFFEYSLINFIEKIKNYFQKSLRNCNMTHTPPNFTFREKMSKNRTRVLQTNVLFIKKIEQLFVF